MTRSGARVRPAAALSLVLFVVAACGGSSLPPPAAGNAPTPPVGASPGSSGTAGGGATGSGSPAAGGAAASAPAGFTADQTKLLNSIRSDARTGCKPRTDNLPPKATAGIDCTIGSKLVQRVGVYAFANPQDALAAYIARMAGYHVGLRSGDCLAGKAGDVAWTPGDGPDEGGDQPWRTGCFIDENGKANIRTICGLVNSPGGDIVRYIGVLGASTKIRPLLDWTDRFQDGVEAPVPSPPGICMTTG